VARPTPAEKKGKFSVEEFDQIGAINGQAAVDLDLESIEDKPWRQPGTLPYGALCCRSLRSIYTVRHTV
jgi:hypothetical protein